MIEQFSRSGKLQILLKTIGTDPKKYLDEEIIQYVERFQPSQNCEGATKGYFSIISHICYYRPDLEHPLMKIALRPLYYLGVENASDAIKWVQFYVSDISNYYYTSKQGDVWIKESLNSKQNIAEKIFKEIDQEDNAE
ncbi:hypothetical protein [Paenibacillus xylanexedens]|uniref:hypothetical protein n=1 Tax=Paenibacillus xylanexedens TaxID=528191 RepID=UPI001C8DB913|nr:hypothetical protein [Paenibacillus xylanexedens]MBY0117979.1 hypothetical protein [Paenibacillus xylanexedens]